MSRLSLENLIERGRQGLIIIADFDHTLTEYGSCITHQAFDPKTTVKLERETKSLAEMQSEMNSRFTARLGLVAEEERDQLLTDWWSESHEILCRVGISRETVRESSKFLRFRTETSDILKLCEAHSIPFIIVSAGLDSVIQVGTCQLLGHFPRNVEIVANQMIFGTVSRFFVGADKSEERISKTGTRAQTDHLITFGPIIHSENKADHLWKRTTLFQELRDRTVLVMGDTEEDLTILDHRFSGNSYSISVNPKRATPGFDQQFREEGLGSVLAMLKEILCRQ